MVISGIASIVETIKWVYYSYLNKDPRQAQASEFMLAQYAGASTRAQGIIAEGGKHLFRAAELAGVTTMNMPGVGGPSMSREAYLKSIGGAAPTGEGLIPSAKGVSKGLIGEAATETLAAMSGFGDENAVYNALRYYGLIDPQGKPTQKAKAAPKPAAPAVKDVSHKEATVKPGQKLVVQIEHDAAAAKQAE
jgi:hypothetical protein